MELKEFFFPDDELLPSRYAVLYIEDKLETLSDERYLIQGDGIEGPRWVVQPYQIDELMHMLTWIRAHHEDVERESEAAQAVQEGNASEWEPPQERDDSAGVIEEDG